MTRNNGFTLVELSIVLVIVAFLTGGVLTANSMIHEARVNSTIVWVRSVQTGYMQFEDIYSALPGDMSNASSFFPGAANGNGNGRIDEGDGSGNGVFLYWESENQWFWNHITSAGMLKGQLFPNVVCCPVIPGYNVPSIPISTGLTGAVYNSSDYGSEADTLQIDLPSGWFGAPGVNPKDALEIDQKMDDGLPRSGSVFALGAADFAFSSSAQTCYVADAHGVMKYDVNNFNSLCALDFRLGGQNLQ